jgi:hypothetical protein
VSADHRSLRTSAIAREHHPIRPTRQPYKVSDKDRAVLHPVEKGFEIELIGEITAMVDLGAKSKTAGPKGSAVPDPYRCSVKVVAGVGFEPTTFRL